MAMTWWNRPKIRSFDGIICDGSVRSGKTLAMTLGFFLWSMATTRGKVYGICGKTIGSLRRNMIVHLADWLGGLFQITEHRSENKLILTDPSGRENIYYLFGGQDEGACQLIQGITLAGVLMDEVVLMPRSFVEQACARCSEPGSKLWFNCNPEGPEHWFYKEWILHSHAKRMLHLHFTMEDNPGLEENIKRRYERLYSGVFYRRFVLGHWCMAEGLVYDFDPDRHISTQFDRLRQKMPPDGKFFISVDYGTQNPFSAGLWLVTKGKAYRLREFYHDGRATGKTLTDQEYCDALEKLAGQLPVEQVVIDPSASSMIAALRKRGRFRIRKAKNRVLPGIRLVQSLLATEVLQFSPDCVDSIREFGLYRWAEGDVPLKENDHAMDDIRYFCSTILRKS